MKFLLFTLAIVFGVSSSVNTCPEFTCTDGSIGNSLDCFPGVCTQEICCDNMNCVDDYDATLCASGIILNVPCVGCDIIECCEPDEPKEPSPTPNRSLQGVMPVPDSCPAPGVCLQSCGGQDCNASGGNSNGNAFCQNSGSGNTCCAGSGC